MNVFDVAGKYTVLRGNKTAEPKYRIELSARIVNEFGKGPFATEAIPQILTFCQNYYIAKFEDLCFKETSYTYYKEIMWLHEQAAQLRRSEHFHLLPAGLDKAYIGGYRRILKMILEQGCTVKMITGEKRDENFRNRMSHILNDLLYLGEMIFRFTESIAEQAMVEDMTDITFDANNLYHLERRHHYEFVFEHITNELEKAKDDFIIDTNGHTDFKQAILQCFNIDYDKFIEVIHILHIHFKLEPGDCFSASKDNFIKDVANHAGKDEKTIQQFLSGLTLCQQNRMPISTLIYKPYSLNRFLYRPFLIWMINSKPFYVLGLYSLDEAENSLILNAIPWGKYPDEWANNQSFKLHVDRKKDEHDKWLDNRVEKIIKETELMYDRNVKKLMAKGKSVPITGKNLGEIDFLIISPVTRKILVTECKHLLGRYDMVNWRQDYEHFTKDGKTLSYNSRLKGKVQWLNENFDILEQHFQLKYKNSTLSLKGYTIEGVFVINTPTFYMYNSDFRIYTYHHFKDVLLGAYVDPTFTAWVEKEEGSIQYFIKYPYLRKPNLLYFELLDEDGKWINMDILLRKAIQEQ